MPMLPVPAFAAAVLAWLAIRSASSGGRPWLTALLAACAAQSLALALAGGWGVGALRPVLPVGAAVVPPLVWITFRDAMIGRLSPRAAAPHAAAPAFALFASVFAPATVDVVTAGLFVGYGSAVLLRLRGSGNMPLARLGSGPLPTGLWQTAGWALIASALGDASIAFAHAAGRTDWAGWLTTIASCAFLLVIGLVGVQPAAAGDGADVASAEPLPEPTVEDAEIVARLDALLSREPLHLDPGLTLARLARRLHLPEKRLSAAVNRTTGANVSRHVNGWRVRHACDRLANGATATDAMLESGFNTKSNFHREFGRVTGTTPTRWRADQARTDDPAPP
ncbi:AraC family transcriptional regulator [Jannaschia sp. LMIT008]|uniref:helix-turn-helix domain-containing protein n=1 Tax=Jannaschia maritima TaxID=3032585 RepID=UPI00281261EB|nr:AraC family transcriptional regulator [Jannaschia sp. LMIT008]